jgi:CHAT domain-containing protein
MTLRINESGAGRFNRLTLARALLIVFALGVVSFSAPAAQIKQEYFVRQEADEALLIRISAHEAEIESNVFAPEQRLLLSSVMPQSRLVPIFQFIDSSSKSRQLELVVSSGLSTANSKFEIEFTRQSAWDNRSAALERAYRLLSFGMQSSSTNSAADWTVKINSLMSAGNTFEKYGMLEMRLWTSYLTAHLVQYRLHDYNLVLGLVREILADTRDTRWQDIELATLQLRGAALIGLRRSGALQTSASDPDPVQTALLKTAERADAMGYQFEKAQTLNLSALEYKDQSSYAIALEQFQSALEIADSIGDDVLAKGIRENMAQIHAGQGDDPATNKVLQEIETRLAADGGGDELALNLLQQGRIFIRNYRYPQAIAVLTQALLFENDSSIRTQVNLELARSHFETGQRDAMTGYLLAAGIDSRQASTYFLDAYKAAVANPSGIRHAVEREFLKARSLAREGRGGDAVKALEQLIDRVLFLRQSLPGVLGAWFVERHEDLIGDYLGLQSGNGKQSLLALSKIRYATRSSELKADTDSLRTQLAQRENAGAGEALARLNSSIEKEMNTLRMQFRNEFSFLSEAGLRTYLNSLGDDEAVLTYHLTKSAAYVWVARNGKVQQRKLANPRKLYTLLKDSAGSAPLPAGGAFDLLMDDLGERLLGPVADLLTQTVYVVPAGLLSGFPMDALRWKRQYLLERHFVVNLLSFPSNPGPSDSLQSPGPQNVFLAGDPQDFAGSYATRIESSTELRAVADIFIGPGLHIIQGAALLADEFQSEQFKQANLVHLAMPGAIDVGDITHSSLQLSEPLRGLGRSLLRPADIRTLQLNASMVVLSATQAVGIPHSDASYKLGIVSDFLLAGGDAVIARFWVTQNESTEKLLTDFYTRLYSTGNVASALTETKRQYLREQRNTDLHDWAGLQLFTN